MPNALLLDIAIFLKSNGLGEDGVDIFRDFSPESPDNIIVLQEYTGGAPAAFESAVNRSIQVTVRNTSANSAREKAISIFNLLKTENGLVQFTVNRCGYVVLRQSPFKIEQDKTNRIVYGFNIGIITTID